MLLICSRMLLQSAAIGAKKSLADYKITACVKEIYLLGVVYKVLNRKTLSGETFCSPDKKFALFYELLIGQQPTFLECIVIFL